MTTSFHCASSSLLGVALVRLPGRSAEPDRTYRTAETGRRARSAAARRPRAARPATSAWRCGATSRAGSSSRRCNRIRLPTRPGSAQGRPGAAASAAQAVTRAEAFREWLQAHGPGEAVKLALLREDKPVEATATLAATSRPMKLPPERVYLGIELGEAKEGEGVRVERLPPASPAATAGIKSGDRIVKFDWRRLHRGPHDWPTSWPEKKPGDVLDAAVRRDGKDSRVQGDARPPNTRRTRGPRRPAGAAPTWSKDVFRLAVVGIEFPDVKHNAKVPPKEWEAGLLQQGQLRRENERHRSAGLTAASTTTSCEQSAGRLAARGQGLRLGRGRQEADGLRPGVGHEQQRRPCSSRPWTRSPPATARTPSRTSTAILFLYAGERGADATAAPSTTRTPAPSASSEAPAVPARRRGRGAA